MMTGLRNIRALLSRQEQFKALVVLAFMMVTALVEVMGIASIMPFLAVVADPTMVEQNEKLSLLYTWLGFESTDSFLFFLGGVAFLAVFCGSMMRAATQWLIIRFTHTRQYALSRRLMGVYLRRPYAFFLKRNSSDLAKSVLEETRQAVSGALMPALSLASYLLQAVVILGFLVMINPGLAVAVAVGLGGVYALIFSVARSWLGRIGKDRVLANQQRFMAASEAFGGVKEIRLLGREQAYLNRYGRAARRFALHQANAGVLGQLPQHVIEAIAIGGALFMVLILMSAEGGLSYALPIIGAYALAGKRLIPAFQRIFHAMSQMRFAMPAVENLLKDLGTEDERAELQSVEPAKGRLEPMEAIEVDNVTFHYPESEGEPALNGLSMRVPAHTTIGLVGASGAGKSTLVDILLGLLEPESGAIRVDGVTLDRENVRAWQASIGYVPQHIFLADDTVAANIALGARPGEVDHEAVERAARLANLHEFVMNDLPEGYATEVGERGVRFSGGQRQRVGIARALYHDPSVIVMDEATSALDNATERAVMEAVHNLSSQKTIILIAHRLTTVKPCDKIFVLEEGRVVEQGTWDQLTGCEQSHFKRLASGGV